MLLTSNAAAQEWPARPVRIIVPFPPGGAAVLNPYLYPDVRKRFADMSAEPVDMAPAEIGRFIKQDAERWRQAIEAVALQPE